MEVGFDEGSAPDTLGKLYEKKLSERDWENEWRPLFFGTVLLLIAITGLGIVYWQFWVS